MASSQSKCPRAALDLKVQLVNLHFTNSGDPISEYAGLNEMVKHFYSPIFLGHLDHSAVVISLLAKKFQVDQEVAIFKMCTSKW